MKASRLSVCVFVSRMGSSRCLVRAMCGWVAIEAAIVVMCWQSVAVDVCVLFIALARL